MKLEMKQIVKKYKYVILLIIIVACSKDEPLVLEVPTTLNASSDSALKIELTWDNVPNALGYNIYRADYQLSEEDLVFELIESSESSEFVDLDVTSNSSYSYRVEAFNGDVLSELSKTAPGNTRIITLDEAFDVLAEYTGGKRYNANTASEVPDAIVQIINENAKVGTDLIFLVDNTQSMWDDISAVKNSISNIISKLPSGTRLGMASYNDANTTPYWYEMVDLDTDYDNVTNFLNAISVYGGGDLPESVYDGIHSTLKQMSWSSTSKRMVIVIGDAPPLEGSKSTYSLKEVIDLTKELGVEINLFPILIR